MRCDPGLRLRLWFGGMALAVLTTVAAGMAVYGLSRSQMLADEAMAAQRRAEAYGIFSGRVNEWMLGWLVPGVTTPPDTTSVIAALDDLDHLIATDVAMAPSATEAALRARQSITPARLRGLFVQLEKALAMVGPGAVGGESAISFYAAQAPIVITAQVTRETRRREMALAGMEHLRRPLHLVATGIAIAAPVILAAFYLLLLRPLFRRLSMATHAAETMAFRDLPTGSGGHDELGLMFARLRQMALRLDRRRSKLVSDYARLEGIVAERTIALSRANERLTRVDNSRRRFFADVSHELRTPLTVIMGEAELGAGHADPQMRVALETIQNRAQRLFRRIEDLLRIARSETGKLELARESVDIPETVAIALADLMPALKRAGVVVHMDLPPLTVAGDGEWLRQVFAGFFDNAAKYAGCGAVVSIAGGIEAGQAVITIADTGPGLPADRQAIMFDRFARGNIDSAPGFGVGLALAKWVVESLGGNLTALPEGPGLRLRLTLPLWKES